MKTKIYTKSNALNVLEKHGFEVLHFVNRLIENDATNPAHVTLQVNGPDDHFSLHFKLEIGLHRPLLASEAYSLGMLSSFYQDLFGTQFYSGMKPDLRRATPDDANLIVMHWAANDNQ